MKRLRARGVTLVEMAFIVAIIGSVAVLMQLGVRFVNNLYVQRSQIEIDRDAQSMLHAIIRDVRNCRSIVSIQPDTLVLQMFNTDKGYDVATNPLFDPLNVSTVTYQFVSIPTSASTGAQRYLMRTKRTSAGTQQNRFLINQLSQPISGYPMFQLSAGGDPSSPQSVDVTLRFGDGYWTQSPRLFEAQAMKRSDYAI